MRALRKALLVGSLAFTMALGVGSTTWVQAAAAPTAQTERDDGFDWGWLGLLGLAGLAGLAGRKRDNHTTTTRRDH